LQHRLIVCRIEKNANSNLRALFDRLARHSGEADKKRDLAPNQEAPSAAEFDTLLRDPSWTKAVFLRDPLHRLLSAYLSKCVQHEDSSCINSTSYARLSNCTADPDSGNTVPNGSCEGFEKDEYIDSDVPFPVFVAHIRDVVQRLRTFQENALNQTAAWRNVHWDNAFSNLHIMQQAAFCGGLARTIGWYDYVGLADRDLGSRVRDLLVKIGRGNKSVLAEDEIADLFPIGWC
jgi:hypothetical protein